MHRAAYTITEDPEIREIREEFSHIVGYSLLKEELIQICDSIRNRQYYERLGAEIPHGLLLSGVPGVGKTTMAEAMARACRRPVFRLRRRSSRSRFIGEIRKTFELASEAAPSILILDDIDKYADGGCCLGTAEEYVALQTCIDELGDSDVFIVATANNVYNLPESLIRCGRFDRRRRICSPSVADTVRILELYLKGSRRLAADVDLGILAVMACGYSCAYIESLANDAAVLAGYERRKEISMDHFVRAFLKWRIKTSDRGLSPEEEQQLAYYAAGQAVFLDVTAPEALSIVFSKTALCMGASGYLTEVPLSAQQDREKLRIMRALAGRAAVEIRYGEPAGFSAGDLFEASSLIDDMIREGRDGSLCLIQPDSGETTSREVQRQIDAAADRALCDYYDKVRTLLTEHRSYLDRVAQALSERDYLLPGDIQALRPKPMKYAGAYRQAKKAG